MTTAEPTAASREPAASRELAAARDAAGSWVRCAGCASFLYRKRLARNLHVCPECGAHHRLTSAQRVDQLADAGTFAALDGGMLPSDVLGFTDTMPYPQRAALASERTGLDEAVVCGTAEIGGRPAMLAVMDFGFLGGSLSVAVGERIAQAADLACERRMPLVIVTASGGARMQEGCLSLMQMASTSEAIERMREAGLLTVSVITDPTYGGVAASFATCTDIVIVEAGARMGFAGPRVIKQTIREELPNGFQTADFLLSHGQVDMVEPRRGIRPRLMQLLRMTGPAAQDATDEDVTDGVVRDPALLADGDAWEAVQRARDIERPTTLDYLGLAFDSFVELHGDRAYGDCPAIVAGLASIDGRGVAVIGHQKGHTTGELVERNFGMPRPEGYRKALRVMRLAARLGIPVVTLIDTPGAYPGVDAEERGQASAIAECIRAMSRLRTPSVSVVTGEGGSGGALALAVADEVLALENATYSVISPEGCAAILWNSAGRAPEAARALRIAAADLLRLGIADGVIPEPAGGADSDHAATARALRSALLLSLGRLRAIPEQTLLDARRDRFRRYARQATERPL
jgi:acetyl-CoA carboxylase carboxyl transferase alpha subunit/acetyl-CoA carboxylase carboxyl transferase beta subunit